MSITGACLILFLTFHALMNGVAIFWPQAYNVICEFLGANWYALVGSLGLAFLFLVHIIYALCLTFENRKARGNDRYKVTSRPKQVEWSSKNMLVLGIVILAFLVLHLIQFWAKMQLAEIRHSFSIVEGQMAAPAAGTLFLQSTFSQFWVLICYVIGFIALWFHLTHGFWSMFHTAGWNNDVWIKRLKCIGNWWSSIVVGLFLAEAIVFTCMAMCDERPYLNCPELKEQYNEFQQEFVSSCPETGCVLKAKECDKAECDKAECAKATCEKAECEKAECDKPECKEAKCDGDIKKCPSNDCPLKVKGE